MMLEHLGEEMAARAIENAYNGLLQQIN